ncbi:MAG: ATP-dependent helicase, partial [Candidatus Riflebacteria bacterium]|nr:ATP-dependent helicase [Candidatus Riflebacteria bacterium]
MSNILKEDLIKLNDRQLAIIKKFDKASLIVAGPGTGKTRTISVLIGSLLEKGVRLREILALTFSSKAADELKERVLEYYPHSFDRCWISTFHSFCARILREQYHLVGIKPDFRLLTGFKEALIMDEICKRQDSRAFKEFGKVLKKRGFQQEVLTFISLLKSNLVSPDEFEKTVSACKSLPERTINRCSELLNIFKLYENERIKTGYLDFRDLIGLTIKVLKNKVVANSYQKMFKVILVDEFQDTDPAQYLLLTLLRGENTEIKTAVIGDPHQSIYRFRGADPSMMSATSPFKQKYKARVFPLEINYRSSEAITNAANRMQWSEKSACESKLTNLSGRAGFAKYYKVRDELDEARLIGRKIASMVIYKDEKQYKPSDIAILVRNNYQIDLITESLKSLHIPFDIAGDMKFFKSEEVILLSSLFKYAGIHKPEDEQIKTEALKRAFVSPVFGINPLWVQSVLSANDSNSRVREVIEKVRNSDFSKLPETDEETQMKAVAFVKALSLIEENKDKDVETILAALLLIISERAPEPDSLEGRNILHFRGMIADYCELFEATNKRKPLLDDIMPDFDEWLAYYASTLEQTSDTGSTGVKIMTVHQSKGLEFPVVFLCGLSEDLFPVRLRENILISTNALEELKKEFNRAQREVSFFNPYPGSFEEHLEEERRLFFVALTRAKDGII